MQEQLQFFAQRLQFEIDPSDLFDALQQGQNMVVIDARKPDRYNEEHIPGALNLPHREMNEQTTGHWDRSATYAVYCDGVGCNASIKGAYNLSKLGFKVKDVFGGLRCWKEDGYATEGHKATQGATVRCDC